MSITAMRIPDFVFAALNSLITSYASWVNETHHNTVKKGNGENNRWVQLG